MSELEKLMIRYRNAEIYLDEPYYLELKGEELEKAIEERLKYVPLFQKIIKRIIELRKAEKVENV